MADGDSAPGPEAFMLRKYDADRQHELTLNEFAHALEMDRLKLLLLLNGGAFTVTAGFAQELLGMPGPGGAAVGVAMLCWLGGLLAAAIATQVALDAQICFAKAYHKRRRAIEWRALAPFLSTRRLERVVAPLPKACRRRIRDVDAASAPAEAAFAFDLEASRETGRGSQGTKRVKRIALAAVALFVAGGLALLSALFQLPTAPAPGG